MTAPFTIAPKARDLTLQLNDSCNCCCWSRHPSPKTMVYVNAGGEVVEFDARKADEQRAALARSIENLTRIVNEMAVQQRKDPATVMDSIKREVVTLDPSSPVPLTLGMIERVRIIVKNTPQTPDYLHSRVPPFPKTATHSR